MVFHCAAELLTNYVFNIIPFVFSVVSLITRLCVSFFSRAQHAADAVRAQSAAHCC